MNDLQIQLLEATRRINRGADASIDVYFGSVGTARAPLGGSIISFHSVDGRHAWGVSAGFDFGTFNTDSTLGFISFRSRYDFDDLLGAGLSIDASLATGYGVITNLNGEIIADVGFIRSNVVSINIQLSYTFETILTPELYDGMMTAPCFPAGTMIRLADGAGTVIEDVTEGSRVSAIC